MSLRFDRVFMVIGNNDFKGPLINGVHNPLNDGIAAGWNVVTSWPDHPSMNKRLVILNSGDDGRYDFMDDGYIVSLLGCTFWSNHRDDQCVATARFDRAIPGDSSEKNNERHQKDLKWIQREIREIREVENDADRVIIVMTHHAPCIKDTSRPSLDGIGDSWSNFQIDILGGAGMPGLKAGDVWGIWAHALVDGFRAR